MNSQSNLDLFLKSVVLVLATIFVEATFLDFPFWEQPKLWFVLPCVVLGILFLIEAFKDKKLRYDNVTDVNNRITAFFTHIFVPVSKHFRTLEHAFFTGIYEGEFGEIITSDWGRKLDKFFSVVILNNITNINLGQDYYVVVWSQRLENFFTEHYPDWEKKTFYWDEIPNIKTLIKASGFDKTHELYSKKMLYIGSKYNKQCNFQTINADVFSKVSYFCGNLFGDPLQTIVKNPKDFEKKIANDLKQLGFSTYMTKATGDQGVDVLATKNDINFAIQCKLYSHPVGNKAVQEVCAGREFYRCDYAVVVTNSSFTKAARQCAKATDVILLNDNQLDELLKYTK